MDKNTIIYGDGGFNKLKYQGLDVIPPEETATGIAYFQHIYSSDGFGPTAKKRHACLLNGYWCWLNVLRYPLDIVNYLKIKMRLGVRGLL